MPTTNRPPPIYTGDFGGEYTLSARSILRKHFYGRSRGILELTTEEPQSMTIPGPYGQSSTIVLLRGSYKKGKNVSERTVEPFNWIFRVRTRLKRRLFYTTKPLEQEPTVGDTQVKPQIGLRTEILQSEERECAELTWRNDHIAAHGTIIPGSETASTWHVTIPLVFSTDHSLVPSFLSATVALRYSILLDLRIVGLWSSHVTLEVSLQVIYRSRTAYKNSFLSIQSSSIDEEEYADDANIDPAIQPPQYRPWAY